MLNASEMFGWESEKERGIDHYTSALTIKLVKFITVYIEEFSLEKQINC